MIETRKYFDQWRDEMREKINESSRRIRMIGSLLEIIDRHVDTNTLTPEVYGRLELARKEWHDQLQKTRAAARSSRS